MSEQKPKHPGGRPTKYSPELADRICEIVASNPEGLPRLCKKFPELPSYETINQWRWKHPKFADNYAQAKRNQAELMAEAIEDVAQDLIDISYVDEHGVKRLDSGMVAQARLVIDSRKWLASKLAPKIYGDRQQVETKVTVSHEDSIKELE